jgi:predicted RND superfamily exporter protein
MAGQLSEMIESFRRATEPVREKMDSWKQNINGYASKRTEQLYRTVLASPAIFVLLLIIIATFLGQQGLQFQDQIEDDVEIFLPDGAESTDLLLEVREEWSTDIAVIYIQTDNARLGGGLGDNITDEKILKEISWIEGDDDNVGGSFIGRGMDHDKADYGSIDGVLWIISPAQIMKEINSADGRFNESMCTHGVNTRIPVEVDCSNLVGGGRYAIPDQNTIDQIIENSSGAFEALIKDTNDNDLSFDSDGDGDPTNDMDGDGIWDTTAVIVGMRSDVPEQWEDFDQLLDHFGNIIDNRPTDSQSTDMTVTGLTKTLEDISDAIYKDLIKMLPYSVLFTILIISFLHRSAKVVVITGTPILLALGVTFGASVVLKWTLTPMIVATFPILIGLGVDYALHMVNRIEEVRRKELERILEENEKRKRQGKDLLIEPDLWDKEFYIDCVTKMASSTGVAVFLSALTTIVGFSVLIAPQIVTIAPIRSVGLTLVVGILSTLLFSIVLVPALAWLLKFHKRSNPGMWKNIGKVPVRFFVVILLVTGSITAYGVANMDELDEPITGSSEAPEGIESLDKIAQYSEQFDSGQTSMFVFDATNRPNDNGTSNIRDLPVMDAMDLLEQKIDAVESTNTTSIITFLKAVPVSIQLTDDIVFYEGSLWELLHDECWESDDIVECNVWLGLEATGPDGREGLRRDMVNVAFDTLSLEVRSMLLNQDETKAVVYVDQPYMNLNIAAGLRDQIDDILTQAPELEKTRTTKLTGGLPVSLDINEGIHDTQSLTTILTMIILTIVLAIVFRSIRLGIITMIPVAVVILWQPLLMQSGDVNVNIFTAMIGTIVFGIGVDDAIHVMHRIQEEGENSTGIANAIEETGQTIFETTITTVAGISAGFLAAFPGLENFFMLMCLLIVFAFVTSSFVLPSIIVADHTARDLIKGRTTLQEILKGEDGWRDMSGDMTITKGSDLKPVDAVLQSNID